MNGAQEIWIKALADLEERVSKPNYRTWLEGTTGLSFDGRRFSVGVKNVFIKEYLDKNQRSLIENSLMRATGNDGIEVIFCVNGRSNNDSSDEALPIRSPMDRAINSHILLNERYTFETFVVGASNHMAFAAASSIAENPGSYNPLFIYGGVGLGKTHLLQAIAHKLKASGNGTKVLYLNSEKFLNDFVASIMNRNAEAFRTQYQGADVLLVDDIQFICGKQKTEESFFHVFESLHNSGRQIVLSCDCPPKSIPQIEERLRSRFVLGLIVHIDQPDSSARLAILKAKAKERGIEAADEILEFIAARTENIRQIEGALNQITAHRSIGISITLETMKKALSDIGDESTKTQTPSTDFIMQVVAEECGLRDILSLRSGSRERQNVEARQMAMYMIRSYHPNLSLVRVGKLLGGKQAITVSEACKKIENDPKLKQRVKTIIEKRLE